MGRNEDINFIPLLLFVAFAPFVSIETFDFPAAAGFGVTLLLGFWISIYWITFRMIARKRLSKLLYIPALLPPTTLLTYAALLCLRPRGPGQSVSASSARDAWRRRTLRAAAVLVAIWCAFALTMAVQEYPNVGGAYRDSAYHLVSTKNWFRTYVNAAGWIAIGKGYTDDTLYQLQRDEKWAQWLDAGALLTPLLLGCGVPLLWRKAAGAITPAERIEKTAS